MTLFREKNCLVCHAKIEPVVTWTSVFLYQKETLICDPCNNNLERISGEICRACYRPLDKQYSRNDLCLDCLRWEEEPEWQGVLMQNQSLYLYNDYLKEVIAKFKYRGDYLIASVFATELAGKMSLGLFDWIVPIPLSQERLYERGFNQAEALIVQAGFPATHLLTRLHAEKQSKKSRKDRIHLPQVFQLNPNESYPIEGSKILLVDDIYTTGSTLRHAAKVLKANGAREVHSLTVAR
ncbi:ComF family protein [Mesobacillus maritimus]|uniref:ComF family protein n=1 Tax=Mesobacillus maritimus TaxID=1643336 RepID=UPI00203E9A7C|nr:ComF family protein [Mesobacillus maritimus]MCM3585179.1 ComF family protein [Mesobacillus maritimus]MCM3668071.1 ComF family protein [Mesobacillus maritimus]